MRAAKEPILSVAILVILAMVCIAAGIIGPEGAMEMDFGYLLSPPSAKHILGTDQLGRDMFKMALYGGRVSLLIGTMASFITAAIAVVYGAAAGLAPKHIDNFLMRLIDLFMSIPTILYIISIQAALGKPTVLSLSIVIGATSWMGIAKITRAEVRQMHKGEYILAAQLMGASPIYILWRHLLPNFMPSIMPMLIHNFSHAIASEATLSFLGLGMPPGTATWGTLMSLSQEALLTNSWWVIAAPSIFLIIALICITNIGEYFRGK
ncbi:MAG: ABC transporter permease [Clostridiales bacterium]|jgi:peptide/nickel transport system permease protein|nr:ABC transporter permease [Clostridiales bacterium]